LGIGEAFGFGEALGFGEAFGFGEALGFGEDSHLRCGIWPTGETVYEECVAELWSVEPSRRPSSLHLQACAFPGQTSAQKKASRPQLAGSLGWLKAR
jgi:hypothetical protein